MNNRRRQGCAANEVPWHYGELHTVAAETTHRARRKALNRCCYASRNGQSDRIGTNAQGRDASNHVAPTVFAFTIPIATTSQRV